MSRTALIEDAEATALRVVELTALERAAYRATFLADPFSKPTFRRAHNNALDALDAQENRLLVLVLRLHEAGLSHFAGALLNSTRDRCKVARDVAHNSLMDELKGEDRRATRTLSPAPPRQTQEQDRLHRLSEADRADEARRALDLCQAPTLPAADGGSPR